MLSRLKRARIVGWFFIAMASILIASGDHRVLAQEMPDSSPTPSGRMMIPEPLLISVQAAPGYGPAPLLVGFLLNAVDPSGAEIVAYNWNFGDGHTSTEPPILAYNNYKNPGNYIATVTITTADGRSATAFTGVIVRPGQASAPQQRQQNQ
jgi:hypothetical protein